MNKAIRGGVIAVGIVVAIAAYFGDNIRGYYRFKELCETEGGLKVFRPLLKNVGWQASSYEDARSAAHFTQIAFARFTDAKDGRSYDLRYLGGHPADDSSYEKLAAKPDTPVVYAWNWVAETLPGEVRTSRSGLKVIDIATGKVQMQWLQIGYRTFDQDRTLLAAPSGNACHSWSGIWEPQNQSKYFVN